MAAHHAGLFSFVPKIQTERPSIPTTVPSLAEKACRSGGRTPRLPSNQLPPRGVSAHDRRSQVEEMAPSPVREKSRLEAGTKLPPRGCGLQPGLRRLAAGLPGEWASWSFPCARPCGLSTHPPTPQQAPSSSIVITHANVSAPETKGGQASGWGFLSTNNIRCKMCTFDKSINIVLLIFFFP